MKLPLLLSSQPEPWLLLYPGAHERCAVPLYGSDTPPSQPPPPVLSLLLLVLLFFELEFFLVLLCPSGDRLSFRMDVCWMEGGGLLASATRGRGGGCFLRRVPCVVWGSAASPPSSRLSNVVAKKKRESHRIALSPFAICTFAVNKGD